MYPKFLRLLKKTSKNLTRKKEFNLWRLHFWPWTSWCVMWPYFENVRKKKDLNSQQAVLVRLNIYQTLSELKWTNLCQNLQLVQKLIADYQLQNVPGILVALKKDIKKNLTRKREFNLWRLHFWPWTSWCVMWPYFENIRKKKRFELRRLCWLGWTYTKHCQN